MRPYNDSLPAVESDAPIVVAAQLHEAIYLTRETSPELAASTIVL
jgi:hypothetical protein